MNEHDVADTIGKLEPLTKHLAWRYGRRIPSDAFTRDDLLQQLRIVLLECIREHDPTKASLATLYYVRGRALLKRIAAQERYRQRAEKSFSDRHEGPHQPEEQEGNATSPQRADNLIRDLPLTDLLVVEAAIKGRDATRQLASKGTSTKRISKRLYEIKRRFRRKSAIHAKKAFDHVTHQRQTEGRSCSREGEGRTDFSFPVHKRSRGQGNLNQTTKPIRDMEHKKQEEMLGVYVQWNSTTSFFDAGLVESYFTETEIQERALEIAKEAAAYAARQADSAVKRFVHHFEDTYGTSKFYVRFVPIRRTKNYEIRLLSNVDKGPLRGKSVPLLMGTADRETNNIFWRRANLGADDHSFIRKIQDIALEAANNERLIHSTPVLAMLKERFMGNFAAIRARKKGGVYLIPASKMDEFAQFKEAVEKHFVGRGYNLHGVTEPSRAQEKLIEIFATVVLRDSRGLNELSVLVDLRDHLEALIDEMRDRIDLLRKKGETDFNKIREITQYYLEEIASIRSAFKELPEINKIVEKAHSVAAAYVPGAFKSKRAEGPAAVKNAEAAEPAMENDLFSL